MKKCIAMAVVVLLMNSAYSQTISYRSSVEAAAGHVDTTPPSKLLDKQYASAVSSTLEYRGDPEIEFTISEKITVKTIRVAGFNLANARIARIDLEISNDGNVWEPAGSVSEIPENQTAGRPAVIDFKVEREIKNFKVKVTRARGSTRVLLSEVFILR